MKKDNLEEFYEQDYFRIFNHRSIGFVLKYIHSCLDEPFKKNNNLEIIEVGAGNSQHFSFTKLQTKLYLEVDIRSFNNLSFDNQKSKLCNRKRIIDNAEFLSKIGDESFDGMIATCLLAHLNDLEIALSNWRRCIRNGGTISIYVPHEPGMMLRFARYFTTKRLIARAGYNHSYIHWKEHKNHYPAMKSFIENVFKDDLIVQKKFPFRRIFWDFNLYSIFHIKIQKIVNTL